METNSRNVVCMAFKSLNTALGLVIPDLFIIIIHLRIEPTLEGSKYYSGYKRQTFAVESSEPVIK